MKKKLVYLFLCLYISNSSANTASGIMNQNVGKKIAAVIIGKKAGKVIGATTFLAATGAIGFYLSIEGIRNNPKWIEYYLEKNPEHIPLLVDLIHNYDWAPDYLDNIGVGDNFATIQGDLENTQAWQLAYSKVLTEIVQPAENKPQQTNCKNLTIKKTIYNALVTSPSVFKNNSFTQLANSFYIMKTIKHVSVYDINSYEQLHYYSALGDNLENDHIPAKSTVRDFLNLRRKRNLALTTSELNNLYQNLTAITVSEIQHKFTRTFRGKNSKSVRSLDMQNLKIATTKDLANHFLYVSINDPNHIDDFIESGIVLYYRNKNLCLYD